MEKYTLSKHCERHLCMSLLKLPLQAEEHLTHAKNILAWSVCRVLYNGLHLGEYWYCVSHLPNARQKEQWLFRCKIY